MTTYRDGKPRCEARIGTRFDEYGQAHPVTCHRYIGLRSFEAGGRQHYYCGIPSHEAKVRAVVARMVPA